MLDDNELFILNYVCDIMDDTPYASFAYKKLMVWWRANNDLLFADLRMNW